jgi:AraC-like DNA-binding protein
MAVPAKRGLTKELTLTDGTRVTATLVGDEHGHFWLAADGTAYQAVDGADVYASVDRQQVIQKANATRAASNARRMRRMAPRRVGEVGGITGQKKGLIILVNFIIYNKNTRLRMRLASDEAEVLHRITSYAMRCQTFSTEILTPYTLQQNEDQEADPDFARVMGKIVPFIQDCKVHEQAYDMQQLAEVAGVSLQQFYDLMMLHLNDSPRLITLHLRLQKVADMLATTDKPVELIADELGFVSPNYLIASFFHHYRLTPADYRNSRAR